MVRQQGILLVTPGVAFGKTKGSSDQEILPLVSRLHPHCLCNRSNFFLDVKTLPRFAWAGSQCLHVFLTEG